MAATTQPRSIIRPGLRMKRIGIVRRSYFLRVPGIAS